MNNTLTYHLFSPGGNNTALVTLCPHGKREYVTRFIMRKHPDVEQVGFIEFSKPGTLLTMSGNELCINAIRCAILLTAMRTGRPDVSVRISGVKKTIKGRIRSSRVIANLPYDIIKKIEPVPEGALVYMRGIRFIVTSEPLNRARVKKLLAVYSMRTPAVGAIRVYENPATSHKIVPWVWVKKTNVLIRETGCGSGSIAVCAARLEGSQATASCSIIQPSRATYLIRIRRKKSIAIEGGVRYIGAETIVL